MDQNLFLMMPGIEAEEMMYLQALTKDFTEQQLKNFVMMYQSRRKDPQQIMIFTLLGFVGFAGIQRFILGEIGMGVLYFFTWGICLIGTIMDLVNYKKMALEFNQRQALEAINLSKMMG